MSSLVAGYRAEAEARARSGRLGEVPGHGSLGLADVARSEKELAVEVRHVDRVEVNHLKLRVARMGWAGGQQWWNLRARIGSPAREAPRGRGILSAPGSSPARTRYRRRQS